MFSKNAKQDFKERMKKINAQLAKKKQFKHGLISVNTIHSLAYYINKQIRQRASENDSALFRELLVISAL
jgi:hypothetical protein